MTLKLDKVEPYHTLGLSVTHASAERAVIRIPLTGNRNDKGTAFGGSLFSAMALAAWRLCDETAASMGESGDIVIKDSQIDFLRPVDTDVIAVASHAQTPRRTRHGNLAFDVAAETVDADGKPCARMRASFRLLHGSAPAAASEQ